MKKKFSKPRVYKWMRRSLMWQVLSIFSVVSFAGASYDTRQGILQKKISLQADNMKIKNVLKIIEQNAATRFGYQPQLIDSHRTVSLMAEDTPVISVLNMLFDSSVKFDEVGGMVIFKPLTAALAESILVTGKAEDETGAPLPGVNVTVKGTTLGTSTDLDGKYTLSVDNANAVLVFTFVGYVSQEVNVGSRSVINVQLKSDQKLIDEVVVVGYGAMNRRELTSAISSVKSETFAERPIFDVAQAMQGNAAGVNVVQPSGKPGGVMEVRVRGANSINSGTSPLYVIDGIQTYDISGINPDDIVDINILKDATSTAIYGVNGSAGVVVITTKRGKGGTKNNINFNTYFGISNAVKTIDILNLDQFKELMGEIRPSYLDAVNSPKYSGIVTNWEKEVLRSGLDQNYNLSYTAHIKKANLLTSVGYQSIKGIMSPAQFNRFSGRINADAPINPWLKINASLSYFNTYLGNTPDNVSSGRGGVLLSMLTTPPMLPVYADELKVREPTKDGEKNGQFALNPIQLSWENPVAFASAQDDTWVNRFMGSLGLEVTLSKNLVWKPNITYDYTSSKQDRFTDRYRTGYGRSAATTGQPTGAGAPISNPTLTNLETRVFALRSVVAKPNYNFENTLTYTPKKDFSILLGNSVQEFRFDRHGYAGNGFPIDLRKFDYDLAELKAESQQKSAIRYMSFFGRINYTIHKKYVLSGVFRTSGASQLAKNNKWGFSPGVSGAWLLSEEEFMKNSKVINVLKLRGGWGRTGNVSGIPPYSSYSISRPDRILPEPISYSIRQFENSELTWETTDDANIAIDVTAFKHRVNFSVDFYQRKTKNLLLNMYFPFNPSVPYLVNGGNVTNKGVELTLNTFNIQNDKLNWNTSLNLSANRNNVDEIKYVKAFNLGFFERTTEYAARLTPGQPIGSFFGYKVDKVDPETGKLLFKDANKDGKVDAGDRTFIGNPHPAFTFGLTNNVTYKNFYANMLISGSVGNKVLNATRLDLESMIDFRNQSTNVLRRWKKPGDITDVPKVNDLESVVVSDRIVEDGSFARVKALTLGYNFKNLGFFSKINLYITAQNLLTFTKYSGFDPEVNAYSGSTTPTFGIDYGTYPQVRTFIIGLKAGIR